MDVLTLGQYMRPTKRHMAVAEYVTPQAFAGFQKVRHAQAGAFVFDRAAGSFMRATACSVASFTRLPAMSRGLARWTPLLLHLCIGS